MKLLAIETATDACSAALAVNGQILERFQIAPQQHTSLILPMIDGLLAEAGLKPNDLDALAFGRGPGSFTGVRIATGIIQGIAFGLDLPIVPISTLASIAQVFFNDNHRHNVAFVALDARLSEIFWGVYQRNSQNLAELVLEEAVTPANVVDFPHVLGVGMGSGWAVYGEVLSSRLSSYLSDIKPQLLPSAKTVAQLGVSGFLQGQAVSAEHAIPIYLRNKVAKTESERSA